MKLFIVAVVCLLSVSAHALETRGSVESSQINVSKSPLQESIAPAYKQNLTEIGMAISAINSGSSYGTIGLFHEFDNGFTLGARGYMPLQFNDQAQAYMGQLVGRFMLLNAENQMYIDANLTQGVFNGRFGTELFGMIGASYGYMRKINNDVKIGAALGVDYASHRISEGSISTARVLYNSFLLGGSFYF